MLRHLRPHFRSQDLHWILKREIPLHKWKVTVRPAKKPTIFVRSESTRRTHRFCQTTAFFELSAPQQRLLGPMCLRIVVEQKVRKMDGGALGVVGNKVREWHFLAMWNPFGIFDNSPSRPL
jgi:hypothetical protein